MHEDRCPYCLQRVTDPAQASMVDSEDPLAGFIGVDDAARVHADCYQNAADRA